MDKNSLTDSQQDVDQDKNDTTKCDSAKKDTSKHTTQTTIKQRFFTPSDMTIDSSGTNTLDNHNDYYFMPGEAIKKISCAQPGKSYQSSENTSRDANLEEVKSTIGFSYDQPEIDVNRKFITTSGNDHVSKNKIVRLHLRNNNDNLANVMRSRYCSQSQTEQVNKVTKNKQITRTDSAESKDSLFNKKCISFGKSSNSHSPEPSCASSRSSFIPRASTSINRLLGNKRTTM